MRAEKSERVFMMHISMPRISVQKGRKRAELAQSVRMVIKMVFIQQKKKTVDFAEDFITDLEMYMKMHDEITRELIASDNFSHLK